ncbi:MAG: HDOD domain-containing protein [Gammaproteobacteria bacterium]
MAVSMIQDAPPAQDPDEGTAPGKDPRSLMEWVERLSDKGVPVFAKTVKDIAGVTSDRESSAAELSRVILQDAAMTARLLRVANSPAYSFLGRNISTVSRAVVLLGFETVRSLCLSIAVIDAIGSDARRSQVADQMARSFHAAIQARAFAERRRDRSPEEVFIATLLCNIGELAFWSIQSDLAAQLGGLLQRPGYDRAQAEREVLGFELRDLSLELTRKWNLGKLLEHTLEGKGDSDPRVSNVRLAHELARCAEDGWDSKETRELVARLAETLYMPLEEVTRLVHENAGAAVKAAQNYGVAHASEFIPLPPSQRKPEAVAIPRQEPEPKRYVDPDPLLQLTILRELSVMLEGKHDINLLLEMVLEGISRGIGLDRTLFAMLNPERSRLRARYALGWEQGDMREAFLFEISPLKANIFSHVLDTREALWVGNRNDPRISSLLTAPVRAVAGDSPFFVMPIEVNGRSIGLFYADRKPSGRPLDEEAYTAFRHFCQQANLALAYSRRGR